MTRSPRPRKTVRVSDSVLRQLNMYALAAGAGGVVAFAGVQPSEAKIVYTPAHQRLPLNQDFFVDLNHDGTNDFRFHISTLNPRFPSQTNCTLASLFVFPYGTKNGVIGQSHYALFSASALRFGAHIGPKRRFPGDRNLMAAVQECPSGGYFGLWENNGNGVRNRYLGLKFTIKGTIHYGWARMNVRAYVESNGKFTVNALLTGYAYETIPGKAIIAGATNGPDDTEPTASLKAPTPAPATLGMFALGAPGLSIWRRKESLLPSA